MNDPSRMSREAGRLTADSAADRLRRRLQSPQILLLPAVHDALSARLAQSVGLEALFVGGYGVAASRLGVPDIGLATMTEMTDAMRSIAASCSLPVIGDGDTGYGSIPSLCRTVRAYHQCGLASIMIEDQISPKRCGHLEGKQVVSREEALSRVRAAVREREALDNQILILARTDARVIGFDEALWRVQAFEDLGADMLFLEAPESEAEMSRFVEACSRPCLANMLAGGLTPILPPARLQEMGFAMVAYAVAVVGAAAAGVQRALMELADGTYPESVLSHKELLSILDYERFRALESSARSE